MSELSVFWDMDEESAISAALDKLFTLQDRPLSEKKKSILLEELKGSGLPVKAIAAGLNKLMSENLSSVKFSTLVDAARGFLVRGTEHNSIQCDHCMGMGRVVMRDQEGREFALACVCSNGSRYPSLKRWSGEPYLFSRGQQMEIRRDG